MTNITEYLHLNPMGSPYLKYALNEYSQCGEDGVIAKILEDLSINEGTLVEFGAWDGIYLSNIYNLHRGGNFNAILIESDIKRSLAYPKNIRNSRMYNFTVSPNRDDRNSIDSILDEIGYENKKNDLVLMSIDIDSSDYYVMESIEKHLPIIIVIETSIAHALGSNFKSYDSGCSFDSVWDLGVKKGYSLVAYTSNAILVRNDHVDKLKEFKTNSKKEDIYIDEIQYLTLARLNERGEIMDNYFGESKRYLEKVSKEKIYGI